LREAVVTWHSKETLATPGYFLKDNHVVPLFANVYIQIRQRHTTVNSSLNLPSEKCAAFRIAISNGESQLGFPNCRIMLRQHLVQLVNIARLACLISPESGEKERNPELPSWVC